MTPKRLPSWILVLAFVYPSVLTYVYFVVLAQSSAGVQQAVYSIGKLLQFTLPLIVFAWTSRRMSFKRVPIDAIVMGLVFGLLIMGAIIGLERLLSGSDFIRSAASEIRTKVAGFGVDTLWKYVLMATFYSLIHAFLEEYYWRWFVFHEMLIPSSNAVTKEDGSVDVGRVNGTFAILLSSLGFMAHHVIVLATYFGWKSGWTYLFSFAVAVGGVFWAWLYRRTHSLIPVWLSHSLVDAAIFVAGWNLLGGKL